MTSSLVLEGSVLEGSVLEGSALEGSALEGSALEGDPPGTLDGSREGGVLGVVGRTPLVPLDRLFPDCLGRVYGKLEGLNPGGSSKDRPALEMIRQAKAQGRIGAGSVIVESSSGNMGIGLAQACARLGLRFICVIDIKTTEQNRRILSTYGAEIDLVEAPDPETGELLQARLKRVQQLLQEIPNAFWPNQYASENNARAHFRTLMPEILGSLHGPLDVLMVPTSTCGTIRGCCDFVAHHDLKTRIVAVDALGSQIFSSEQRDRYIPGLGAGLRPHLCPEEDLECIHVTDEDCVVGCRRLVRWEGILAGGSSGAAISAFTRLASGIPKGANCVLILPDRGERYLDTVFNDRWVEEKLGVRVPWDRPWQAEAAASRPEAIQSMDAVMRSA